MCARHEPHTCNLTLMGDGVCFVCVYNTRESECLLCIQQHTNTHAAVNSVCLKFYSLEFFPCTYTCVDRQRERADVRFRPWGKCGWSQSDLGSEGVCVWTAMCPPRSHLSHTWSDHTKEALGSCSPLWTHRGHTHTEACAELSYPHGARVYKEITASRTAAVGLSLNSHSLDKLSHPPGEMGLIFAKLWSFFCNQGKRWCSDRFVESVFDCCPPRADIQRNWANVNASELV